VGAGRATHANAAPPITWTRRGAHHRRTGSAQQGPFRGTAQLIHL